MKKFIFGIIALVAAVSCGKESLPDVSPKGESAVLTIPGTKVGINGNSYAFESGDVIVAVASNGSVAELKNSDSAVSKFSGVFSKPLEDSESISLYYNCCSTEGNISYAQNGKPWLQAANQTYSRGADNNIQISAALDEPSGVRAVAVTAGFDGTVDFTSRGGAVSGFDGSNFSGEASVSGLTLSSDNAHTVFVNVPKGLAGGFWLKFQKDGKAMYKSYASDKTIDSNMKVNASEFVPVNVTFDVNVTGFPTSYSYYIANEGIDGISVKDVAKANATANDWIGAGEASYTMKAEGISSKLLQFVSFNLVVDGDSFTYSGEENTAIKVDPTPGHNTWGQKDIKATVIYKAIDGTEFTGSATITRHITGLPYVANPPKNSGDNPWKVERGTAISWNANNVTLKSAALSPQIASPTFNIPENISVAIKTKITRDSAGVGNLTDKLQIWNDPKNYLYNTKFSKNQTLETTFDNATMTSSNNIWHINYTYAAIWLETYVYYFNINYR